MAYHDISDVTKAIIKVLDESFAIVSIPGAAPNIFPLPPGKVHDGLSLYLYHIQENIAYKNMPPPGKDYPPVRYTPMALNLFYQLSAHKDLDPPSENHAFAEQLMMSISMKALHDYPEINENTQINGHWILPDLVRKKENGFKICLQPIPYNEAVHFWTSTQSPIRLSAYYEVSVIFLEPEPIKSYAGRVLTYGTYVFPEGALRITNSQSVISYTAPDDGTTRYITAQPAQVVPARRLVADPHDPLPPPDLTTVIELLGTGFSGRTVQLQLLNYRWNEPAIAATHSGMTVVSDSRVKAIIPQNVELGGRTIPILPGIYAAQVKVIRQRTLSNGETREFENTSNQFPFTICPRIDRITEPDGNNIVIITSYIFNYYVPPPDPVPPPAPNPYTLGNVEVYIGERRLIMQERILTEPGSEGHFRIARPGVGEPFQLQLKLPDEFLPRQTLPLRLIVSGAESLPQWITHR